MQKGKNMERRKVDGKKLWMLKVLGNLNLNRDKVYLKVNQTLWNLELIKS